MAIRQVLSPCFVIFLYRLRMGQGSNNHDYQEQQNSDEWHTSQDFEQTVQNGFARSVDASKIYQKARIAKDAGCW